MARMNATTATAMRAASIGRRRFRAPRRWPTRSRSMPRGCEAISSARLPDFAGPLDGAPVQGRPVESDLPAGDAGAPLRAAAQAARQAAAVGARGRPRVPRHQRAASPSIFRWPSRCSIARTRASSAPRSISWAMSRDACSGSRTCRGAAPAERAAVYDAMNATLARLHSFDPAAIGLADFGRGENYVARQVERWSKQYRASRDRADRRDGDS